MTITAAVLPSSPSSPPKPGQANVSGAAQGHTFSAPIVCKPLTPCDMFTRAEKLEAGYCSTQHCWLACLANIIIWHDLHGCGLASVMCSIMHQHQQPWLCWLQSEVMICPLQHTALLLVLTSRIALQSTASVALMHHEAVFGTLTETSSRWECTYLKCARTPDGSVA